MELSNSICAVDIGSWTSKISALTNNNRFEILVNEANFRETPSVVSLTAAQRLIGDQAVIKMKSNFKNTIRSPHRLVGLARKPHLIQEELRYSTVKYRVADKTLIFEFHQGNSPVELTAEQLVVVLFTKFKNIYETNGVKTNFLFLSVQSYLNNGERKALKSCAEAAGFTNVSLVEEWEAISSQYFFVRQKEIEALHEEILVIFVDLGYTNFAVHACSISKNKLSLLDQEYLRYTGSKNIDGLLVQFYIDLIKKQAGKDIRQNQKAMVKLLQAVQVQRKKLSANTENQLTIECLLGDYDLSYNMKREQLENIAMPVIAEFASAMQNLRSRVQPLAPIHSIQLIGGVSRMPFIQEVVRTVFNAEPSKKMNASQSISRGCCIAGSSRLGLLKANMCTSIRTIKFPIFILIHTLGMQEKAYGKQIHLYNKSSKKILFDKSSILPANTIAKIEGEGQNQVLICQEEHLEVTIIGHICFKGTDNLTVLIDTDGIMRARLMKQNTFDFYDFGDLISVDNAVKLREEEEKMRKRDRNILQSYQIRNQFESLLYNTKQALSSKWSQFCPPNEASTILEIVENGQQFVADNSGHSSQDFRQRIETINVLTGVINNRRLNYQKIEGLRQVFVQRCQTLSKLHKNAETQNKLEEMRQGLIELYNKESGEFWEGNHLNQKVFKQILHSLDKLK